MEKKNRLAIFFFYDADGIADRYVDVYLQGLQEVCGHIVVVANGIITPQTRRLFSNHTNDIIVRKNVGFDAWAHKAGLEYIGWDKLRTYDEVVLTNFTLMGPVYPFSEMFDKMSEQKNLDFWGMTAYHKVESDPFHNPYGYIPDHIQSSFIVYRKKFLETWELKEYWDHLPEIHSYNEAVGLHESFFTKHFEDQGFEWDVYADNKEERELTNYFLIDEAFKAVKEKRCPAFKRRSFFQGHDYFLTNTMGEQTFELLCFLKNKTTYDVDLIWENLLRTCNQYDFVRTMGLRYVLPSAEQKEIVPPSKQKRVALVMHLYYMDLLQSSLHYASSMPADADIYITTANQEKIPEIKEIFSSLPNRVEVRLIANRGRDVSSLLVGAADVAEKYDYVCFFHDKKVKQVKPFSIGQSFSYKMAEGTLHSKDYVQNIVNTFENNPRLGLLTPTPPNHSVYYISIGMDWGPNYENTKKLAEELGLKVQLSEDKPPVAPLGTTFWFRAKAMKKLFERGWKYTDFPPEPNGTDGTLLHAIERIYPFVVQDAGYYPAYVMPDFLASIELTNLEFYLRNLNQVLFSAGINGTNMAVADLLRARLEQVKVAENEEIVSDFVFGNRQMVYMNDPDLLRAARLSEEQDEAKLYTIGFAPSWTVFCISMRIWSQKHSLIPSHRKRGRFLASQQLPSVKQTWWLVRKTFVTGLLNLFHRNKQ